MYHGLNYVYKKNSDSYLVQFKTANLIQLALETFNVGYAVVNVLSNTSRNICQTGIAPAKDPVCFRLLL